MRLIWLVPAAFAGGLIAQNILVRHAPRAAIAGLSQPLAVVTAWHNYGVLALLVLLTSFAIGAIGYLTTVRDLLAGNAGTRAAIVVGAASIASLLIAWAMPLLFSSDVYAYAAYGAMSAHGINPYAHSALPSTSSLLAVTTFQWGNPPPACVYGPLFVAIARAIVTLTASLGVLAQLQAFRVLASLAFLACGPLLYAVLRDRTRGTRIACVAMLLLNPVAIWSAVEGHNDTIMLACALGGFVVFRRSRSFLGAALVAFSGAIKAPGLIAAGAAALALLPNRSDALRALLGVLLGFIAVASLLIPFANGIGGTAQHHAFVAQVSLTSLWAPAAYAAAALLAIVGIRRVLAHDPEGWCWLALGAWVAIPNPYPWYALWFLPVTVLAPRSRVALTIVLLSLTTALRYLPDASGNLSAAALALAACAAFAPLLALVPVAAPLPSRDLV